MSKVQNRISDDDTLVIAGSLSRGDLIVVGDEYRIVCEIIRQDGNVIIKSEDGLRIFSADEKVYAFV